MREEGYLAAPVPKELGGLGAGLLEMSRAQQALARGCASTALAVNMHVFQVGTTADAFRAGQPVEPLLRRIADEGIVIGSNGAESIVAGPWTTPTTAEKSTATTSSTAASTSARRRRGWTSSVSVARDTETGELLVIGVPRSG